MPQPDTRTPFAKIIDDQVYGFVLAARPFFTTTAPKRRKRS